MSAEDVFNLLEKVSTVLILPALHFLVKTTQTLSKLEGKVTLLEEEVKQLLHTLLNKK